MRFTLDGRTWATVEHYFQAAKTDDPVEIERVHGADIPDLRARLIAAGEARLIEAAPRDYFWGAGAKGTGKNWLGVLLMELRKKNCLTLQDHIRPQPA